MTTTPTYHITPALRFPDFANYGEWEVKRLGDCLIQSPDYGLNAPAIPYSANLPTYLRITDISDDGYYIKEGKTSVDTVLTSENSLQEGDIVFARTGASVGKVYKYRKEDGPLVFAGFLIRIKPDNTKLCSDFLFHFLFSNTYNRWVEVTSTRSGQPGINSTDIASLQIPYPPLAEQQRIAVALSEIDTQLSATNDKLKKLKAYKKGLLQKLFPAKSKTLPEFRFKEFENDGEWKEKNLGEVTQCINRRNKSNRALPIYSISNTDGFIPQSEQFAGLDSGSRGYDISLYKIVGKHTFAYNPARINVGSIGYSGDLKDVLISSLYVCFKTSDEMDDSFLMYFFSTSMFKQTVENNVEGGIRSYLFYENFSKIKIAYPTLNEQKKIALCLSSTDDLINTYTNKLLLLQTYKTGLMQQLFP